MLLPATTAASATCPAAAIGPSAATAAAAQALCLLVCKQPQVICQHISNCILQQRFIQPA